MKETLNSEYNFVSKALDLADPTDSVNFDEIVAVSPPPNDVLGLLCSQVVRRDKTGQHGCSRSPESVLSSST